MQAAIGSITPRLSVRVWSSAHAMITDLPSSLMIARLISLDHDLLSPDGSDVGDGLNVARWLATRAPVCPVIVHSSNADRATQMVGTLQLEGWPCLRVLPFGNDWVEMDWLPLVQRLLSNPDPTFVI
jgi:hypothetical protein